MQVFDASSMIYAWDNYPEGQFPGLWKWVETGVEELDQARLPNLIELKYHSMADATDVLGGVNEIKNLFINFQKHLYERGEARSNPSAW